MSVEPIPCFATATGGSCCGRRGLPESLAHLMYQEYLRLGSLSKVAKEHGRTRQAVWDILKRRGYRINVLKRNTDCVLHEGMKFTPDKNGFLRCTRHDKVEGERYLHRRIWVAANGDIPKGYEVVFDNQDKNDCRLENLRLSRVGKRCKELGRVQNGTTVRRQNERIESVKPWIYKQAARLAETNGLPIEQLVQEGMLGAIEADRRYDASKGANFLTYSIFWIKNYQLRACTRGRAALDLPGGVSYKVVSSLNEPLSNDDHDGAEKIDFLAVPETVTSDVIGEEKRALLGRAIDRLPKQLSTVIRARYLQEKTLDEVGLEMGLSGERIRQLEVKAMGRLRRSILVRRSVA